MADLVISAPAKINLHLEVLGLRSDGFHELAMVMQTIDLADELVLVDLSSGPGQRRLLRRLPAQLAVAVDQLVRGPAGAT